MERILGEILAEAALWISILKEKLIQSLLNITKIRLLPRQKLKMEVSDLRKEF